MTNSTWTSASPGHTNTVKEVNFTLTSEGDLATGLDETLPTTTKGQEMDDGLETVDRYKESGVDQVSRYTNSQVNNMNSMVRNPFTFVMGAITKGIVRGFGPPAFLIAIGKLIEAIVGVMFAPGREFDVRFREMAQDEILKFTAAREQAELRAGFKQIIVTSIGGLRGSSAAGMIGGSFYNRFAIPPNRLDPKPIGTSPQASQGLGSTIISSTKQQRGGQGAARSRQNG